MLFRPMVSEDALAASYVEDHCFSAPWSERVYRETIEQEYSFYMAAVLEEDDLTGIPGEYAGQIVATCGAVNILGEGDISNVAVLAPYRRQGLAGHLMELFLEEEKSRGVETFVLEVRASNEGAISLYTKFGFETVGCRRGFYEDPKEDALIMKLSVMGNN